MYNLSHSFPNFGPVFCFMSGSNCRFLTRIQVFQETGKVVQQSHRFKNFPQFVVIHTVKGFSIVKEAEVDVLLEFPGFFCDPAGIGNLISGSSAFLKPILYIWKFSVHVLVKTSLKDFEHYLVTCKMRAIVWQFEHSLALPLRLEWKLTFSRYNYCCHQKLFCNNFTFFLI